MIDAGTATEVALATFADWKLRERGVSDAAINRIVVQANGAVGLYALATDLGLTCAISKNKLTDRLANKRNAVAHAGTDVSVEQTKEAVACARGLVESATPLQFP